MKNSLISLLLLIIPVLGVAQSKNNVPLLIRTSSDSILYRVEIATSCIKDTTRIVVSVVVRFDENIIDSVRLTEPKEIYLLGFTYADKGEAKKAARTNPNEIVFEDFEYTDSIPVKYIKPEIERPVDKCIREVCADRFKIWLMHQPYSDMYDIERFYGYSGFTLAIPVILIPENIDERGENDK